MVDKMVTTLDIMTIIACGKLFHLEATIIHKVIIPIINRAIKDINTQKKAILSPL